MSNDERHDRRVTDDGGVQASARKRGYEPPILVCYGDVRDVTLGPSPGLGESGNPTILKA